MRVLVYGDIDLNLIDGSAIWLASLTEVLADCSDVEVVVLQRTRIQRDIVVGDLKRRANVRFIDPWDATTLPAAHTASLVMNGQRLQPAEAAPLISALDRYLGIDVLLIRSFETASLLGQSPEIASRLWAYITDPLQYTAGAPRDTLRDLYERCSGILCQTEEAREILSQILEANGEDPIVLLPPMIPAVSAPERRLPDARAPRLGYSGKLSPPYMILEMLDAFERIRARCPGAEFHVIGDKFHNVPPVPGFEATVRERLQNTEGVVWHGGVSREQTYAILDSVDIASSWRAPSFDASLEISTKILEYSALGIPVLMNNCPVQARVYGADYRGWVATAEDFVERFCELATSPALYRQVSQAGLQTSSAFTFARARDRLAPVLRSTRPPVNVRARTRILFAGHDFKFLTPLLSRLERDPRYEVLMDQYDGHVIKDTARSASLLERADLIFCEWSLGNAEWYSRHKRPDQPLVIREHLQGLRLPFLDRIEWNNVDRFIFCARGMMQEFLAKRPFMTTRSMLIYIPIDCAAFDQPKLEGAEFNLGVIGISPQRKGPHLSLEILERLKRHDSRYTLFIKGKHPWEYPWLWRRPGERQYYSELYARIRESPYANSVVFDGFGSDVSDWFSKIGFILSTSDFEGSHQAVAEGMAAGSIPVIRDWTGADLLYPERYVFDTVDQAVAAIRELEAGEVFVSEGDACRRFAREQFDQDEICDRLERLFTELLDEAHGKQGHTLSSPQHEHATRVVS